MTPQFHPLRINRLERFGDFAVAIGFEVPDGLAEAYRYLPGQYLTLRAKIDGAEVRRPYSICTPPHKGALEVGIKYVEGGLFSGFAVEKLALGDVVDVMTPQGRFTYVDSQKRDDSPGRDFLLLAAGSGVTPILSIAETVLATGRAKDRVTLVYGNRNSDSIMFRDQVEYLKDRFLERCRVLHVLSREPRDADILNGRIDGDKVAALVNGGLVEPGRLEAAYLCGPDTMMRSCRIALEEAGLAPDRIAAEHFTTSAKVSSTLKCAVPETNADIEEGVAVQVRAGGSTRKFMMNPMQQTVLSAGQAAGFELPYSCKAGMCCTCRCLLVSGEVEMDANYSLEPWEIEAGFILSCQARPKTKALIVDFDNL